MTRGTELERAVRYIKESRKSHVDAIAWLEWARQRDEHPWFAVDRAVGGSVTFHRKCIREYDLVLKVLRRCQRCG